METALAWKEAKIVPTKIFIWVTPDENMLGKSFLKNNLTSFEMLKLTFNFGLKNFLTNIIKKIAWIKPAIDTPYDR